MELKKNESIQHHTIKFGKKYKEHLEDIFENKKLNQDISYYLHRPSATDSSMCPDNHDCFYVLVPVPNNSSSINWSTEGENERLNSQQNGKGFDARIKKKYS